MSLFCTNVQSQTYSIRDRYEKPACFNLSLCVVGNSIYTSGMNATNQNPNNTASFFTKYSLEGDFLLYSEHALPGSIRSDVNVNCLHYDSLDNILYTTGYTMDVSGTMHIMVLELDTMLNLVNSYEYYVTSNFLAGRNLIRKQGGGYYIVGDMQDEDNSFNVVLIETNNLGNIEWHTLYGLSGFNNRESTTNLWLKDDSTLVSCISRKQGESPGWEFRNIIIEWDTAGNLKSEKLNPTLQIGGAWGIGNYSSGGYYFCAGKCPFQTQDMAAGLGHIQRLDSAYNTLWSLTVGYPYYYTMLRDIKETSDGSLISVGFYFYNGPIPVEDKHQYGWVVKASADGDSVWQRFYLGVVRKGPQLANNELYDMEILEDGSIIACGQALDVNDTFPQQAWLLRLNAEGCEDDGGCGYDPIPLSIEPVIEQLTIFKLYPNPVKDVCTVSLSSDCLGGTLQLSDFNGCELEEWRISSTQLQLKLNQHPPGTYLLHIIRDDGMKISKKVVVHGK